MKCSIILNAFLKPSVRVDFTLLPEGWADVISGSDSQFATGVSRYYEGLKIVLSSVAEQEMINTFLSFIHPALRHENGDVLGYMTTDNKQIQVIVYTKERIRLKTPELLP
jgi:hypothetical protein